MMDTKEDVAAAWEVMKNIVSRDLDQNYWKLRRRKQGLGVVIQFMLIPLIKDL